MFHQITMAFAPVMQAALERGERFDPDVVRSEPGILADELALATLDRIGSDAGDTAVGYLVDHVMGRVVDELGTLAWVAGDRTVHVGDLRAGIVQTHRLTADERESGSIDASFDLAGVQRVDELVLPTGEPIRAGWQPGGLCWTGPERWLEQYSAGSVPAVEVTPNSVVQITELATEPGLDHSFVERVRAAWRRWRTSCSGRTTPLWSRAPWLSARRCSTWRLAPGSSGRSVAGRAPRRGFTRTRGGRAASPPRAPGRRRLWPGHRPPGLVRL